MIFGSGDLAFAADGTLLALVDHAGTGGRLDRCDPAADPLTFTTVVGFGGFRLIPLRDPDLAVAHRIAQPAHRLDVVRVSTGATVRSLALTPGSFAPAVSPDDRFVAIRGWSDRVLVFDLGTLERVAEVPYPAATLAFSADGRRLFAHFTEKIVAFDTRTWKPAGEGRHTHTRTRRGTTGTFSLGNLVASPDGAHLFVTSGGRLTVFDADTLKPRAAFDWHIGTVTGLAVGAGGDVVYTSGTDGAVKVWPVRRLLAGV
jgi:WD40 repeat protein